MGCMREETRWGWPAEGHQCQRRQPCYGLICSARRDGSHYYSQLFLVAGYVGIGDSLSLMEGIFFFLTDTNLVPVEIELLPDFGLSPFPQ